MELTCLLDVRCYYISLIVLTVVMCQSNEKCFDEYGGENSYKQGNVVYVCEQSSTEKSTDISYLDLDNVPTFDVSTCSCKVAFVEDGTHAIRLDYKHDKSQVDALVIYGFGTNFSTKDESKNLNVSPQENDLTFRINLTESRGIKSCLRISIQSLGTGRKSHFTVECLQRETSSQEQPSSFTLSQRQTPRGITENPSHDGTKRQGSTSLPVRDTSDSRPGEDMSGVVIGAAVGGAAVIIIIVVVVMVIVFKRKGKPKATEEEDYYITENATYGGDSKQQSQEPLENYDEINPDNLKRQSIIYSVVDKRNVGKKIGGIDNGQTVVEDEYNHLNSLPKSVVTGNIYSSIGRRGSQPTANIYNSVSASQKGFGSNDNIYNTSGES